jgi:hypothetical protein
MMRGLNGHGAVHQSINTMNSIQRLPWDIDQRRCSGTGTLPGLLGVSTYIVVNYGGKCMESLRWLSCVIFSMASPRICP